MRTYNNINVYLKYSKNCFIFDLYVKYTCTRKQNLYTIYIYIHYYK